MQAGKQGSAQNFLLNSWIIFPCMYRTHFVLSFICQQTLGLPPPFGHFELCCFEHWWTNISLRSTFHHSCGYIFVIELLDHMAIPLSSCGGKNLENVLFHTSCPMLHSYQQGREVPLSLPLHQSLLLLLLKKTLITVIAVLLSIENREGKYSHVSLRHQPGSYSSLKTQPPCRSSAYLRTPPRVPRLWRKNILLFPGSVVKSWHCSATGNPEVYCHSCHSPSIH